MNRFAPWAGLFGGGVSWYAAHDLALYLVNDNCRQMWITPVIHLVALAACLAAGWVSWRALPADRGDHRRVFAASLGVAAAALFALVILWQGMATLIYSGCER